MINLSILLLLSGKVRFIPVKVQESSDGDYRAYECDGNTLYKTLSEK